MPHLTPINSQIVMVNHTVMELNLRYIINFRYSLSFNTSNVVNILHTQMGTKLFFYLKHSVKEKLMGLNFLYCSVVYVGNST